MNKNQPPNFQTRIIEESREKREKRIRDALVSYRESQKEQFKGIQKAESFCDYFREIPEKEWNETLEIMENQVKEKSVNTKNGIFCLKLCGYGFLFCVVSVVIIKIYEYIKLAH